MSRTVSWSNWSGGVSCTPQRVEVPESEAHVIDLVRAAEESDAVVRVAGSGHSFVPLCATDGVVLSLDNLQGVIDTDPDRQQAVVWAGTKLHQLGEPLWRAGLALENQGDIDRQSLAGAISTGTHGTGVRLGNLATQVAGVRLVLASGDILDCSATTEPDVFHAARLSLGALGVITQFTLRLVPAYRLRERTWAASVDECLEQLPTLMQATRHFEFFWCPNTDTCAMKALDPTDDEPTPPQEWPYAPPGHVDRYVGPERVDWSYRIFPSERSDRFNEIEFAVPASLGPDCFIEIRRLVQERYSDVTWPIEYRSVAADDIPLSPAYGRETVTISVHQGASLPYEDFFRDVEAIFRAFQGRPHWGKIHWLTARDLRDLYPEWDRFQAVRERLDPNGRFLSPYLRELLID